MLCRNCGTEIADKAIVCYRCGTATTDPVRKPAPIRPRRRGQAHFIVAAVMLLVALAFGYVSRTTPEPDPWQTVALVLAGAAALVVVLGLVRRR